VTSPRDPAASPLDYPPYQQSPQLTGLVCRTWAVWHPAAGMRSTILCWRRRRELVTPAFVFVVPRIDAPFIDESLRCSAPAIPVPRHIVGVTGQDGQRVYE
jgi:hypothetical protein